MFSEDFARTYELPERAISSSVNAKSEISCLALGFPIGDQGRWSTTINIRFVLSVRKDQT